MTSTRRRDTPGEVALRRRLHAKGLRYRVDSSVLPGMRRRADVAFRQERVAVFVDGCFWHGCPEHGTWPKKNAEWWREKIATNVARDRDTDARLEKEGWVVVRVWTHQSLKEAADFVEQLVRRRRGQPPAETAP